METSRYGSSPAAGPGRFHSAIYTACSARVWASEGRVAGRHLVRSAGWPLVSVAMLTTVANLTAGYNMSTVLCCRCDGAPCEGERLGNSAGRVVTELCHNIE